MKYGISPVILPSIAQCDELNNALLQKIGSPVIELIAVDTLNGCEQRFPTKVTKAYHENEEDVTRTASLEKSCICCVMLKRNKDVENGFISGFDWSVYWFQPGNE